MIRFMPLVLGFVLVGSLAHPAWAQRRGRSGVVTPYGTFSAQEMSQAGGDVSMAGQMREQRQMMQYQQQMFKQQQQAFLQNQKQQDFLKKHPEAAKALNATGQATRKAASKSDKKDKKAATGSAAGTAPASSTPASPKAKKAS